MSLNKPRSATLLPLKHHQRQISEGLCVSDVSARSKSSALWLVRVYCPASCSWMSVGVNPAKWSDAAVRSAVCVTSHQAGWINWIVSLFFLFSESRITLGSQLRLKSVSLLIRNKSPPLRFSLLSSYSSAIKASLWRSCFSFSVFQFIHCCLFSNVCFSAANCRRKQQGQRGVCVSVAALLYEYKHFSRVHKIFFFFTLQFLFSP